MISGIAVQTGSSPKPVRIEAVALVCTIGCVLVLIAASLGTAGGKPAAEPISGAQAQPAIAAQIYEGIISDTHCGAKHSAAIGKTAADCTLACVHGGEQFVLVDGDTVYLLEGDLLALKRVAGQRVRITGTLSGRKISVRSVVTA